jgi:hypothetical protein
MMPANASDTLSEEQMRQHFHRLLDEQGDIGAAKLIGNCLFEPPNIFDPNRKRRLKPEILIGLSYVLLMAIACAAFN